MNFTNLLPAALRVMACGIVALGPVFSAPALAAECLAPAPGSLLEDKSYYELNNSTINGSEQQLEDFATMLSGRWWGTQLELICGTENGRLAAHSEQYRIAAEFNEHYTGALRMEAERENAEALKLNTIWFSPEYRKDRKGTETGWRTYNVSFPNSNTMVFDEKYRVTNHHAVNARYDLFELNSLVNVDNLAEGIDRKGFARLVHDVKTLSLKADNTLTVERTVYVNGFLVAEEGWILERDFFGSLAD